MDYRKGSHTKYNLAVHIVFIPKYRKKILYGQIGQKVRELIKEICSALEVEIIGGKVAVDHVHLHLSYPPHLAISKIVQHIKGKSSYKILNSFPDLKKVYWGSHFWARGYLAVSVGVITDEVVKAYLEKHDGDSIIQGDIQLEG